MNFQRNLISTAAALCALVVGAAHAQSNVTLYGIVGIQGTYIHDTSGPEYLMEGDRLNPSRIGFKGSEDLGGGLSAIFDLESAINPDNGTAGAPFWGRGAYVGLKGGFGTLTAGRHWNINDDILGNFFIFGGYAVFNYEGFGFTSDLVDNSVKYVSPSFGGLTIEALVGAGEGSVPKVYELGGMYAGGPFKAALTYREAENPGGLKNKLASGGVSFALSPVTFRVGYSAADVTYDDYNTFSAVPAYEAQSYDIGVDATFGALGLSLDYVARDVKSSSDDSYFVRLLATYALSKRTSLVANLITMQNDGSAAQGFYALEGPGTSQDVISLGITHSF